MSADGSMAVWCSHVAGSNDATAEVHFNYWRITGDAKFARACKDARDFAEIGIYLVNPRSVDQVCIYLPATPDFWEFEDCGPYFTDTDIAQGIFNEDLTSNAKGAPGPEWVELLRNGRPPLCRVHRFMAQDSLIDMTQLSRVAEAGGTVLTITHDAIREVCEGLPIDCPAYFRVRAYVRDTKSSPFVKVVRPKDRFLQSSYSVIEYIDVRLNETRSLPKQIEALIRAVPMASRIPLTLVAFLTAVPVQSHLTSSNQESHKNRLLEHDIWTKYVPSGIPAGMMVYHWRKEGDNDAPVDDFSAFVKIETRHSGWLWYLALAFAFGVAGNLVASGIWDWKKSWFQTSTTVSAPKLPSGPDKTKTDAP